MKVACQNCGESFNVIANDYSFGTVLWSISGVFFLSVVILVLMAAFSVPEDEYAWKQQCPMATLSRPTPFEKAIPFKAWWCELHRRPNPGRRSDCPEDAICIPRTVRGY